MPAGIRKGASGLAIEAIPRRVLARLLRMLLRMLLSVLLLCMLLLRVLLLVLNLRWIRGIAAILLYRTLAGSHVKGLSGAA